MTKLISGRVAKVRSANVSADRYDFIDLAETEPDLGLPSVSGWILSSDLTGNRAWVDPVQAAGGIPFFANTSLVSQFAYLANVSNTVLTLNNFTTANLVEGLNLYFTNARVVSALIAGENIIIESNGRISANVSAGLSVANVIGAVQPFLTTANVTEISSNLYFTNARVVSALIAGDNITIESNGRISANVSTINSYISNINATVNNLTTADVREVSSNLYFTNTRVVSALVAGDNITIEANGRISANVLAGLGIANVVAIINPNLTTANVTEVSGNLYFTNARTRQAINAGTGVIYDSTTGTISIGQNVSTIASVTFKDVFISNNLIVYGDSTTWRANNLSVSDNMIYLNNQSNNSNPDLGMAFNYYDGVYHHAGFFRDATDGVFKVFDNYDPEPDANIFIDTNHATFRLANLQATNYIGNVTGFVTGQVSSIANHNTDGLVEGSINQYFTNVRTLQAVNPRLTTANVIETSANLYFTNTRVVSALIAGNNITIEANGRISANVPTGLSVSNVVAIINPFLTTANVTEASSNLYFTNTRVVSALIAGNQIIIEANGRISANVTSNPVAAQVSSLSNFTTADLAEASSNLYFTTARARGSFTEGSGISISANGVISAKTDFTGSGLFNSTTSSAANLNAQSVFSNVKIFSAAEGNSFVAHSLHITNITDNTAYLTGRLTFDSNVNLFANLLEVPAYGSLEIFRKPQVFKVGDSIQIQGLDNNKIIGNNLISSYLSFQPTSDDGYQRSATTISNANLTQVYVSTDRPSILESINLVNLSANIIPATVIITDSSDVLLAHLASNLKIPPFTSIELCEYPKTLLDNYKLKVQKYDAGASLSAFVSAKYTTSYSIIPSALSFGESESITFDVIALNVVNGTVLYYEVVGVSGNIAQGDFVSNITGTSSVLNNGIKVTLTANADNNTGVEGNETFKLVVRKGSASGSVLASSDIITLKDTSNIVAYNNVLTDADTASEGTSTVFTINTTNLGPNVTLYYTTVGNVITSDFVSGNSGSFLTTGDSTNVTISYNSNIPANETRYYQLQIRTGNVNGFVKLTSNVVTVVDSLQAFVNATGGIVYLDNGYKTHVFTSSNSFVISGLGIPANRNLYYEIIGGGGVGGYATSSSGVAGGGGAGGFLRGNTTLSTTGTFTVVVGGGGAPATFPSQTGSNSSIFGNTFVALGGGNGGNYGDLTPSGIWTRGQDGGSGGGGAFTGSRGGFGTTGQGYPGGTGTSGPPATGAGGGGGGSAGTPGALGGKAGDGLTSVSIADIPAQSQPLYGTPGPTPGRWFAGGGGVSTAPSAGAGGGGYLPSPSAPGIVNTGGGGAQISPASFGGGSGGSGIVIVRYPYTIATYGLNDDVGLTKVVTDNTTITYSLTTINVANASTLYWTLSGNVANTDVRNGNTGSFTVLNSNATFSVSLANNIVTGNDTKVFTLQLRQNSVNGAVVATAANTITVFAGSTRSNFISATGGTIVDTGSYRLHVFTSSNTLVVSDVGKMGGYIDYLTVAGGGGGAVGQISFGNPGSAGGAGGLLQGITTLTGQTYTVTVGNGGTSAPARGVNGSNGGNTSITGANFANILSIGGGGGTYNQGTKEYGLTGGSGGGGGGFVSTTGDDKYGGNAIIGQGYRGGSITGSNPGGSSSAGGGGAGGTGADFTGFSNGPRAGGIGLAIPWVPASYGTPGPAPGRWFAGGGGGSTDQNTGQQGAGGAGGGGRGSMADPNQNLQAFSGNAFTGGGGGGGSSPSFLAGSGGSGIIIIRYPYV